ncbi:MAG: hypothetical protein HKN87_16205 [Saprospiraceae bacterium]|nr:hypothetical protein [Saprospiraceae bacterium]
MKPFFLLLIVISFTWSCADSLLDEIPSVNVSALEDLSMKVYVDSLHLDQGLFSRKLEERGFTNIYGLAKFNVDQVPTSFNYELILLSCTKGPERHHLLATIHMDYNAISDIFQINPRDYVLSGVFAHNEVHPVGIELSPAKSNLNLVYLLINNDGKISKLARGQN